MNIYNLLNILDSINLFIITSLMFIAVAYTDFVDDMELKYMSGWISIIAILILIAINITAVLMMLLDNIS